jgi:hypothetical protein
MHLAFAVSSAAAIGAAILTVMLLRGVRPSSQPDGPPDLEPAPGGAKAMECRRQMQT